VAVVPVVRYMLLCEDCQVDPQNSRRVNIIGLISNIRSLESPPFPILCRELCVFLALTEGRAPGESQIVCVFEETGQRVFGSPKRTISFGADPLEVGMLLFRIRDCPFPVPGRYVIQFWYDGIMVEQRPLLVR